LSKLPYISHCCRTTRFEGVACRPNAHHGPGSSHCQRCDIFVNLVNITLMLWFLFSDRSAAPTLFDG